MRSVIVLSALTALLVIPQRSEAGLILITNGPTIKHIGEIDDKLRAAINAANQGRGKGAAANNLADFQMKNPSVGYYYNNFGVFWLDLWTWGGTYCLYEGKRYIRITPAAAADALGKDVNDLSKPFGYKYPPGLLILGGILLISIPAGILSKRRERKTEAMSVDPRYQQALQIYHQGNQSEAAFEEAVLTLEREGIPRAEAIRNLQALLARIAVRDQQVVS